MIEETLSFALASLSSSIGVFYWINADLEVSSASTAGAPPDFLQNYKTQVGEHDHPLCIPWLMQKKKKVAVSHDEVRNVPKHHTAGLNDFLHENQVVSVIELLFWYGQKPFAGMCIMKTQRDPRVSTSTVQQAFVMQPYIEMNLQRHDRLREARIRSHLVSEFQLTERELDVAESIYHGRTNGEISRALNIRECTVKAHLYNIFDKIGIENRATLVSKMARY
jgi:ATP/maltotriose-dependent transcriptional regulator MalT